MQRRKKSVISSAYESNFPRTVARARTSPDSLPPPCRRRGPLRPVESRGKSLRGKGSGHLRIGGGGGKGLRRWLPTRECRPPLRPGLPDSLARPAEIQAAVASSPSRTTNTASNSSPATSDAGTATRKSRSRCHRPRPWPRSTRPATTVFAQMASWCGCEMTSGGGGFGNY